MAQPLAVALLPVVVILHGDVVELVELPPVLQVLSLAWLVVFSKSGAYGPEVRMVELYSHLHLLYVLLPLLLYLWALNSVLAQ